METSPERRSLSESTTLQIGGWTDRYYEVSTEEQLRFVLNSVSAPATALLIGRGSNTLFHGGEVERPIIQLTGEFEAFTFGNDSVTSGAGVFFPELALEAARKGYGGLEWAGGVPGTVGGAVAMNAGAFDSETADCLVEVSFMEYDGSIKTLKRDAIEFDYRYCGLRDRGIILSARFLLNPTPDEPVMDTTKSLLRKRRREQPVGTSSAGCIFKNVNGHSAGKLIDQAGLKGVTSGDIEVSTRHANYFVNHGNGTYSDVLYLINEVRREVLNQFGYELETELQIVRED